MKRGPAVSSFPYGLVLWGAGKVAAGGASPSPLTFRNVHCWSYSYRQRISYLKALGK